MCPLICSAVIDTRRGSTGKLTTDDDCAQPPLIASVPAMWDLAAALQPKPLVAHSKLSMPEPCKPLALQPDIAELLRALSSSITGCGNRCVKCRCDSVSLAVQWP